MRELTDEQIEKMADYAAGAYGDEGICHIAESCFKKGAKWARTHYEDYREDNGLAEKTAAGWVSVEDRLPDSSDYVLMINLTKTISVGRFRGDVLKWSLDGEYVKIKITHWMPLPPHPSPQDKPTPSQEMKEACKYLPYCICEHCNNERIRLQNQFHESDPRMKTKTEEPCPDCLNGRDPEEPNWQCPECRRKASPDNKREEDDRANEVTAVWRDLVKLILKGYYNRIAIQRPDIKTLLDWLEDDMNQVGMMDAEEQIQSLIHKK